jgi:hypothetical protein
MLCMVSATIIKKFIKFLVKRSEVNFFLENKCDLKIKIINLIIDLKVSSIKVNFICYNDSGENRSMKIMWNVLESNLSSQELGYLRETALIGKIHSNFAWIFVHKWE